MVIGKVCDERLEPLTDHIGDALAEHHGDDIRIGARAIRQNRGVHHAQSGQAMYAAMLVHHRQRIGHWPHLTSAADVVHRGDVT